MRKIIDYKKSNFGSNTGHSKDTEATYRDAKAIYNTRESPLEQEGVHKVKT